MPAKILKRLLFFLFIMDVHSISSADTPLDSFYSLTELFLISTSLIAYDELTPIPTGTAMSANPFPGHHQFILFFPAKSKIKTLSIQFSQPFIAFPGDSENEEPLALEVDKHSNRLIVEVLGDDSMDEEENHPVKKTLWITSSGYLMGIKTHHQTFEKLMKPRKALSNNRGIPIKGVRHLSTEKELTILYAPPKWSPWRSKGPSGFVTPSLRNLIVYTLPGKDNDQEVHEEEMTQETEHLLSDQSPRPNYQANTSSWVSEGSEDLNQSGTAAKEKPTDLQINGLLEEPKIPKKNQATQTSPSPEASSIRDRDPESFDRLISLLRASLNQPLPSEQQPKYSKRGDPQEVTERMTKAVQPPHVRAAISAVSAFSSSQQNQSVGDLPPLFSPSTPVENLQTESTSSQHQEPPPPSLDKPADEPETQPKPKSQRKNKSSTCHIL